MAEEIEGLGIDPVLDDYLIKQHAIKNGKPVKAAKAAVQLAEDLVYTAPPEEGKALLEKSPGPLKPEVVDRIADRHGVSRSRAAELAVEAREEAGPAIVLESYRAENELKDEFLDLFEEEVMRLRRCPLKVNRGGTWQECGVELRSIQQTLTHHAFHQLWEGDHRVKRAVREDISEKLFPTDIKGARAALTSEERSAVLSDPRARQRLLGRGRIKVDDV